MASTRPRFGNERQTRQLAADGQPKSRQPAKTGVRSSVLKWRALKMKLRTPKALIYLKL
jgi:hypothetical protein